jgi:hypothetical protein
MKTILSEKIIRNIAVFMAVLFIFPFQGCNYYYKVQTVDKVTARDIRAYDSLNKYMILHQGDLAWNLHNTGIDGDMVSGRLSVLPEYRHSYLKTNPSGGNRYRNTDNKDETYILDEVQLYVKDPAVPGFHAGDSIRISCSSIEKAEVYKKAPGRTTASWVVPAVIIPIIVVGGIAAIAAGSKSSCPLVYIKKDKHYEFAGEIFGGAVYSSLERHDYLPLPGFKPSKHQYKLIISNGLPEIQYINLAELWVVNHPGNMKVLPDRDGRIHSITIPETPVQALSLSGSGILPTLNKADKSCFLFDEEPSLTGDSSAFNSALLTFSIPEKAESGKLLIKAGNSMWGDYTYGEFTRLFGNTYGEWIKKQGKEPAEKNIHWKEKQRFALMVYLETKTGWQFVDFFDLIGPLGARDMIMPVDLSKALITNSSEYGRTVRIKLESGFKFWELDYAAMDFSKDTLFTVNYIQPSYAITESGSDITQALCKDDHSYYIQKNTGEQGQVVFQDSPDVRGMKKSIFLHTRGYYEHVRNYTNPPDIKQLRTFLVPGRFSKFSFDNHVQFKKNNWAFAPENNLP